MMSGRLLFDESQVRYHSRHTHEDYPFAAYPAYRQDKKARKYSNVTVCALGGAERSRDAANTLFGTKILTCLLYGLWEYSGGIGMAAIHGPGTCRKVCADWGLITGNTRSACVRSERDAHWPCSGARSTPEPQVGFW